MSSELDDIKNDMYHIVFNQEELYEDKYKALSNRLNMGNSQYEKYDFEWKEDDLLNYADDVSLEIAYQLIERGKISLTLEKNMVCIKSIISSFCNDGLTNGDFLKNCELDSHYKEQKKTSIWKTQRNFPMRIDNLCHTCQYQSCPKRLAAYVLYLNNVGLLKDKLVAREQFRKEKNHLNSFFLFKWENKDGLRKIDEQMFNFAMELVNRDYVRVSRSIFDNKMSIRHIISCKQIQLSNLDVSQMVADYSWENPFSLSRRVSEELDCVCKSYTCRFPACVLLVAGYIYYLKKNGLEKAILEDREYYALHKDEITQEVNEKFEQKIEKMNSQKEEKTKQLLSDYEGKIDNLNYTINSIMKEQKASFHYMVVGDDEEGKEKFIDTLIKLIQSEKNISCVRKIGMTEFDHIYCHYSDVRINKDEKLIYSDNDIEKDSKTYKRDKNGIPYYGSKIIRNNELEHNVIYVLDNVKTFIKKSQNKENFDDKNTLKLITDMSHDGYIIINCKEDEYEPFMSLDARLKFVYQNNMVRVPSKPIEEMYQEYLRGLNADLIIKLREQEKEFQKDFNEYVSLNQKFMPFGKKDLINYMDNYANARNELILPPSVYKKESLDNIIGLDSVKEKLKEFEQYMMFQIQAKANGIKLNKTNMHMIFSGNPGTGKTTFARIMAKMLFDLGIVKENKLVEVERKDLIAKYVGQTAPKTAAVIQSAMGGVLFIDEAYSLSGDSFSGEAIATLIKAMEDHKDNLVVIFAGYKKEMKKFMDMNSGIASRIGYTFDFPDYSVEELMEMFHKKLNLNGFELEEEVDIPLRRLCDYYSKRKNFGNGRFVDKMIQEVMMKHSKNNDGNIRIITENEIPTIEELNQNSYKNQNSQTAEEMLDSIVGMQDLKQELLSFRSYIRFVKEAEKQNIKIPDSNMHMIFTGNPGTGKTTIARIIAKMLFDMEVIHENKLVEVERKDLVAEYIGQTAPKTSKVIESAMGGVLFIDEAYSLANSSKNDFGAEAIATLIKAMEDYKSDLVVIFAGYKKEMRDFLNLNPGIASRIGYTFNFNDYNDQELTEIFSKKVAKSGLKLEDGVLEEVRKIMKYFYKVENIGNGRFVDKVFSKTLLNHSKNYTPENVTNHEKEETIENDVLTLTKEDIPSIQDITKTMLEGNSMIDPSQITKESIKKTAIHEVGHATVRFLLYKSSGIKKITCVAEGMGALGYVEYFNQKGGYTQSKEGLMNRIKVSLAGIGAEEVFFGFYENGGTSDLEKATNIARRIITDYGMSDLGLAHIPYQSQGLERMIYDEENKILGKCFVEVKELISANKEKMQRVVDYLLEHSEIDEEEFVKVFTSENIGTKSTVLEENEALS